MSERDRAVAFLREIYRRRADSVEPFPWGELVATPSLPRVWDANVAIVERWDGDAAELRQEMDRVQRDAGFGHRKVVLPSEELAARLWPGLERLDWPVRDRFLLLAHRRRPDRPADPGIDVVVVGDADWEQSRRAMGVGFGSDAETMAQLLELERRLGDVIEVRHLAAVVEGEVAAYAALYIEGHVAQVEEVATLPAHRGRGLARAVVLRAVEDARRAGAELVFLLAAEDDWPNELYRRLGFAAIGVEHAFGRPADRHAP